MAGTETRNTAVLTARSKTFCFLFLLYLAVRLWHLDYSFWNDEVFSLRTAQLGWTALVDHVVQDRVHPPLFYILLKTWIAIGNESSLWLRLFPLVTSVACFVPLSLLIRELNLNHFEGGLTLFLVTVNEYLITWGAQTLRMYALLLFFTVTSLWLFYKFVAAEQESMMILAGLFLVNLALVYTHYYGWLVVTTQFVYVLLFGGEKRGAFTAATVCLGIAFMPWAYAVAKVAAGHGGFDQLSWINPPDWKDVIVHFATLNGLLLHDMRLARLPTVLTTMLFGYPVLWWSYRQCLNPVGAETRGADLNLWRFLLFFSMLPLVFAFAISYFGPQSFWQQRHLIVAAVPYLIFVVVSASRLQPEWLRKSTAAAIMVWAAIAAAVAINNQKVAYDMLVQGLLRSDPAGTGVVHVYTLSSNLVAPLEYYLEGANGKRYRVEYKKLLPSGGAHFWIAGMESPAKTTPDQQMLERDFVSRGFKIGARLESGPRGEKVFLFSVCARGEQKCPANRL